MNAHLPLPRVLLTNDDGFDAPGLAVLAEIARTIASEVWIIAPAQDQSGASQKITTNTPLRCQPRGDKQWTVSGTPSDCIALGASYFMKECPPSLILCGINDGSNVGDEVSFSGTLGAAFTGLTLGIPSIAVSLACLSRKNMHWDTARAVLPKLFADLIREGWDKDACLSVNLPDLPPEKISGVCRTHPAHKTISSFDVEKREDLREKDYFWIRLHRNKIAPDPDSDIAALKRGQISVTALTLDRCAPKNPQ
jgi:5'-nucleotidase